MTCTSEKQFQNLVWPRTDSSLSKESFVNLDALVIFVNLSLLMFDVDL